MAFTFFKCHTKLNHFQTPQHLFSKTRQNLLKNKVCCGHKVLGRLMQEKLGYICRPIDETSFELIRPCLNRYMRGISGGQTRMKKSQN